MPIKPDINRVHLNLKVKQKFVRVVEYLANPEFSRTKKLEILR